MSDAEKTIDLSGTWTGMKGTERATLKDLELTDGHEGERNVLYVFSTTTGGGAGFSLLSCFIGPNAKYTRLTK